MITYGTFQGRFQTLVDVPAITAFPVFRDRFPENFPFGKTVKQFPVPPLMIRLYLCDLPECMGYLRETFFFCNLSKLWIKGAPFHLLPICG